MTVSANLQFPLVNVGASDKETIVNTSINFIAETLAASYTPPAELIVANVLTLPYDSTTDLSNRQALRFRRLVLDGTLSATAAFEVVHPAVAHEFYVSNTSGQTATIRVTGQPGVAVTNGQQGTIFIDGTTTSFTASSGGLSPILTVNDQVGLTYTILPGDSRTIIRSTNPAANTVTIPLNATAALPIGTMIAVVQGGAGATTIVPTVGVTVTASANLLAMQNAGDMRLLFKTAADRWDVFSGGGAGALRVNLQTGTAYTTTLNDLQSIVTMNNAAANTLSIPENATVAYPVGAVIYVSQLGAGLTTVAGVGAATVSTFGGTLTLGGQYGTGILMQTAVDQWVLFKGGASGGGGFSEYGINEQTGTAYTLVLTDARKLVTQDNASANTVSIPTNATVAFPLGTFLSIGNAGAGELTIDGAGVTIINPGTNILATNETVQLLKIATDTWRVIDRAAGSGGSGGSATIPGEFERIANTVTAGAFLEARLPTTGALGVSANQVSGQRYQFQSMTFSTDCDVDIQAIQEDGTVLTTASSYDRLGVQNVASTLSGVPAVVSSISIGNVGGLAGEGISLELKSIDTNGTQARKIYTFTFRRLQADGTSKQFVTESVEIVTAQRIIGFRLTPTVGTVSGTVRGYASKIGGDSFASANATPPGTTLIESRNLATIPQPHVEFTNLDYDEIEFFLFGVDKPGTYRIYYQVSTDNGATWQATGYTSMRINQNTQDFAISNSNWSVAFPYTTPGTGYAHIKGLRSNAVATIDSRVARDTNDNLILGAGTVVVSSQINAVRIFEPETPGSNFSAGTVIAVGTKYTGGASASAADQEVVYALTGTSLSVPIPAGVKETLLHCVDSFRTGGSLTDFKTQAASVDQLYQTRVNNTANGGVVADAVTASEAKFYDDGLPGLGFVVSVRDARDATKRTKAFTDVSDTNPARRSFIAVATTARDDDTIVLSHNGAGWAGTVYVTHRF